jgi:hypothetical protein
MFHVLRIAGREVVLARLAADTSLARLALGTLLALRFGRLPEHELRESRHNRQCSDLHDCTPRWSRAARDTPASLDA